MKCQGRAISITSKATTLINIDANPDEIVQQRLKNDPEVAANLKSFGISKVDNYINQNGKKVKKDVSYVMTAPDAEKAKCLIKKFAQVLPELINDDAKKLINNAIDDIEAQIHYIKRIGVLYANSPVYSQRNIPSAYNIIHDRFIVLMLVMNIQQNMPFITVADCSNNDFFINQYCVVTRS